jgi:glutathione S-transferase
MSDTLKLYHAPASPNSRRVRMFIAEKGIAVPLVAVDLGKGEQHGEAYRAINPRRVVPSLVLEDGTAVGEVLAIWRYLEEAYPRPPLLGSTPKEKALHHVGTARRARGFCRRHGGRSQRFRTTERPRDCWTPRL